MIEPLTGTLKDKIVFIQGAGRWPGPLLVKAFARQGARVAACDVSPSLIDPLEFAAQEEGWSFKAIIGDASRGMPARALLDEVLAEWGRIDILINNPRVAPQFTLLDTDDFDWQHTMDVNLNGPFLLTRLSARMMREQGGGIIFNLVSTPHPRDETFTSAVYAASQAGLLAFSQAAARELIAYNIDVYTLCLESSSSPSSKGTARGELTDLALFLCSPAAERLPLQVYQVTYPSPDVSEV